MPESGSAFALSLFNKFQLALGAGNAYLAFSFGNPDFLLAAGAFKVAVGFMGAYSAAFLVKPACDRIPQL